MLKVIMHKLRSEEHIAGFSMNTETENYLVSTVFFFGKYLQGKLFVHSTVQLSAQTTTHLSTPLLVNVNVFACLLCSITNLNGSMYTVELWMYLENC